MAPVSPHRTRQTIEDNDSSGSGVDPDDTLWDDQDLGRGVSSGANALSFWCDYSIVSGDSLSQSQVC